MGCGRPSVDRKRAPSKGAPKSTKNLQSKGVPKITKNLQSDATSATSSPKVGLSSFPTTCSTFSGKSPSATSSASPQTDAPSGVTASATSSASPQTDAPSGVSASATPKAGASSSPTAGSASWLPPPPPPPSLSFQDHGEESRDERHYRDRFNEWYKVIVLGGAGMAFLYGELKDSLEKEVEVKMKEKELKEKQCEIERKEMEIELLQTRLENRKSW